MLLPQIDHGTVSPVATIRRRADSRPQIQQQLCFIFGNIFFVACVLLGGSLGGWEVGEAICGCVRLCAAFPGPLLQFTAELFGARSSF